MSMISTDETQAADTAQGGDVSGFFTPVTIPERSGDGSLTAQPLSPTGTPLRLSSTQSRTIAPSPVSAPSLKSLGG